MSAIKNSLIESCYNIVDHAWINSNKKEISFIFIKYDTCKSNLRIAICDFGVGIAYNIKNHFNLKISDKDAIKYAMEDSVTTRSTTRNRGWGMQNIILPTDIFWVISNQGLVSHNNGKYRTFDLPYEFPGTILFYELTLSSLADEEILSNFELKHS